MAKTKRVVREAPGPRVARDARRGPNHVTYHTTTELTMEAVDESWGSPAIRAVPGIGRILASRYRIRIYRRSGAVWDAILEKLDAAVRATLGAPRLEPCPPEDDVRRFRLPDGVDPVSGRVVFEGVTPATGDPVAAALFRVEGVTEVTLDGAEVAVRKGRLFSWDKLEPALRERLK